MKALEKFGKNKYLKFAVFAFMFVCWLLPFVDKANYLTYEIIGQISVAVLAFVFLIIFKEIFLVLEIVLLFPFIYSHSMTVDQIPYHLFVSIGIVLLGLLLHIIIYKQKPNKPKFLLGFIAVAVALALGGLLFDYEGKVAKMLLLGGLGFAFVLLYVMLTAATKPTFRELSAIITYLGVFLILQMIVFYLMPGNADLFLKVKRLDIGWANNGNSFSIVMLFCFPFTFYAACNNKQNYKAAVLYTLSIFEIISIIVTYSRGAVLAAFVSYLLFVIASLCHKGYRKKMLWFVFAGLMTLCGIIISLWIFDKENLNSIIANLTKINLDSINGRVPIYEKMLEELKTQPIFGFGMFHSFGQGGTEEIPYLWGHNTFIHAAYTLGILGFLAMVFHHIQKYAFCFKNRSFEKVVLFFSFLATDIYGFIDVSYFFINFMIVLLIILIMADNSLKEVK